MNMHRRHFLKKSLHAAMGFAFAPAFPSIPMPLSQSDEPLVFTGTERFDQLVELAKKEKWRELPIGRAMGTAGMALRGTPYVGSTLELYDDREVCSINLLGLDCVTFFENCLAFARMLKSATLDQAGMLQQVTFTRYRSGKIGDYLSRLHYTSDWFFDNERKGVVKIVTKTLPGAERFDKTVGFMSAHPQSYRQLRANPTFVKRIAATEQDINKREKFYLPKSKVQAAAALLQTGDIVGITTSLEGLDCSHTGLCYRDEAGKLRFLHASSAKKEVVLDDELDIYLANGAKHTGVMIARPEEIAFQ
jgi:hypothetical protein